MSEREERKNYRSNSTDPNEDLLIQALVQIVKHPETWDQAFWATQTDCGTAFCVAGHVATMTGWRAIGWQDTGGDQRFLYRTATAYRPSDEERASISDIAKNALQISFADKMALFDGGNDLDDVFFVSAGILKMDPQVLKDKVQSIAADGAIQDV